MHRYKAFAPRTIVCDGHISASGFPLRSYLVNADPAETTGKDRFGEGVRLALRELPGEGAEGCPGAGFVIKHRGARADYVILAWWTHENEMPTRVFVTDPSTGMWRAAEDESFCVWDLEVMWRERNHDIHTVLNGNGNTDVADYLRTNP